jgi:hypothetical protein
MRAGTVDLFVVAVVVALTAACPIHAQLPPAALTLQSRTITPSEPDVIWRRDGDELPPNAFGKDRNAFSADGRLIGVVEQPDDAWLLNAADGSLFYKLPRASQYALAPGGVYTIAFSPTGQFALGRRYVVELFDEGGRSQRVISCEKCLVIDAVTFSADGSLLAFQGGSGPNFHARQATAVVDMRTYRFVRSLAAASNRPQIVFAPDGQRLLASAFSLVDGDAALGFEVASLADGTTSLRFAGEPKAALGVIAAGRVPGHEFVAVYGKKASVEMRDLVQDRVIWTAPLLPPIFAPPASLVVGFESEFERGAIAPNGRFIITYEAPIANPIGRASGGIVVRNARDGSVIAVYNVYGVTGLSIAPDSKTFVYSTGAGKVHTALVRVPQDGLL